MPLCYFIAKGRKCFKCLKSCFRRLMFLTYKFSCYTLTETQVTADSSRDLVGNLIKESRFMITRFLGN
jgi:hypothetical protein